MGGLKALRAGGRGAAERSEATGTRLVGSSVVNAPGSWGDPSC
jgi:hypothetical protein